MLALQVPPETASSNAASWVKYVTGYMPIWPHEVDRYLMLPAAVLLIAPIAIWAWRKFRTPPMRMSDLGVVVEKSLPGANGITQTHSGHGHNIVAEKVSFGAQFLTMTDETMSNILNSLHKSGIEKLEIEAHGPSSKSVEAADKLAEFLRGAGKEITRNYENDGDIVFPRPTNPFVCDRSKNPPLLMIDLTVPFNHDR